MDTDTAGLAVIVGYGATGTGTAAAIASTRADRPVVVIDLLADVLAKAERAGFLGVRGDATLTSTLARARVPEAGAVFVTAGPDSVAVCVTAMARELNPRGTIATVIREAEHEHFARCTGADAVVLSSAATGAQLGHAVGHPLIASATEAFLVGAEGALLQQRTPRAEEIGQPLVDCDPPVLAVVRNGVRLWRTDPSLEVARRDDQLIGWQAATTPR